jgi:STAS domain
MTFDVGAPLGPAEIRACCERLRSLLLESRAEIAVCDAARLEADGCAIEALARIGLTARRLGRQVELRGASRELRELVAFVGLADVLRVEPGRQAEEGEERLRVEEEGELDDSPA